MQYRGVPEPVAVPRARSLAGKGLAPLKSDLDDLAPETDEICMHDHRRSRRRQFPLLRLAVDREAQHGEHFLVVAGSQSPQRDWVSIGWDIANRWREQAISQQILSMLKRHTFDYRKEAAVVAARTCFSGAVAD
jgi:hypothetical protein